MFDEELIGPTADMLSTALAALFEDALEIAATAPATMAAYPPRCARLHEILRNAGALNEAIQVLTRDTPTPG